jgi:cytoskeletal protein CcmA (bactofilin family)
MAIFSRVRKPNEDEDHLDMDHEAELELPAKPGSRGGGAGPGRPMAVPTLRDPESRENETRSPEIRTMEGKTVAEPTRPSDMARRPVDSSSRRVESEARKLIVGREISLQGEITHCDHLVVEGSITANLSSCREVEILEGGVYKGSVDIDQIEIRGLFEGTMNVAGRLFVRSSGRVVGTVRYGQIEIELGGQISGDIQSQAQQPSQPQAIKGAAKAAAATNAAPVGAL